MRKKQVKPVKAQQLNSYYEESKGLERELIGNVIINLFAKCETTRSEM